MKKQTGIWIDKSEAIIVTFLEGSHNVKRIESKIEPHNNAGNGSGSWMGGQHLNDEKKSNEREKHQLQQFFDEILILIGDVQELYVFGPADTKFKFEKRLIGESHLCIKLMKTETADSMTENQVVAAVQSFFELK